MIKINIMDALLPLKSKREHEYAAGRARSRHSIVLKDATAIELIKYLGYFEFILNTLE